MHSKKKTEDENLPHVEKIILLKLSKVFFRRDLKYLQTNKDKNLVSFRKICNCWNFLINSF